jgi:hypothetical protein
MPCSGIGLSRGDWAKVSLIPGSPAADIVVTAAAIIGGVSVEVMFNGIGVTMDLQWSKIGVIWVHQEVPYG